MVSQVGCKIASIAAEYPIPSKGYGVKRVASVTLKKVEAKTIENGKMVC